MASAKNEAPTEVGVGRCLGRRLCPPQNFFLQIFEFKMASFDAFLELIL